ncbi:IKI3 family-domain-containing protein [Phlyctochytrium arcticum]|nr:IKI3 family-domain-containing protein [Phlyctochytrium arcticum]
MRNLTILREEYVEIPEEETELGGKDVGSRIAVDPTTGIVYTCFSTPTSARIYQLSPREDPKLLVSFPSGEITNGSVDVTGFDYVRELQALFIAFEGGDIALVHLSEQSGATTPDVEVVGTVESGVLHTAWSPDGALLILVTGGATIIEMTKDFDVITEMKMFEGGEGVDAQVALGWGKKETQFHGSAGKQAAKEPVVNVAGGVLLGAEDDCRPRISWRGDGALFAISAVQPSATDNRRVIRVYDRESVLQNTSEVVPQLGHQLHWRPSGNLIASSQRLPHRHDIIFFEKNGLRHGEFTLRDANTSVVDLAWNSDSTVLALLLSLDNQSFIQLWTMGNYHWYLKQELRPTNPKDVFATLAWSSSTPLTLYTTTQRGTYRAFEFCNDEWISSSLSDRNPGTVAVSDGTQLLLTPFKHLNVPPPMSALQLQVSRPVRYVAFGPGNEGDDLAVVVADGTIELYASGSVTKPVKVPTLMGRLQPPSTDISIRQVAWIADGTVLALGLNAVERRDQIWVFTFEDGKIEDRTVTQINDNSEFATSFIRLKHNIATGTTLVVSHSGAVGKIQGLNIVPYGASLPSRCIWIETARLQGTNNHEILIGLDDRNRLYCNQTLLASDCTSFTLHNDFLIFATFTHTARFVSFHCSSPDHVKVPDTSGSPFDEHVRRVERGSRTLIAIPGETSLVLQMPRGNLETISPRALVLAIVRRAIDAGDYTRAFVLCRKHRIDMNLLVDHAPLKFRENVKVFVEQISDPDHLNLFISSLRDEDVTVTMYFGENRSNSSGAAGKLLGKVNELCELLRTALEGAADDQKYVNSILTTDVRKSPPDLETAMSRILSIRRTVSPDAADHALKYVIFLADVDKMYDVALGMYDFALVLMVAQHSHKDPREYLPFLSELQKLELNYQRFRIDDYLDRKAKAVKHLSLAPGEERYRECLAYIDKHQLYKAGMAVFDEQGHKDKYRDVVTLYADHMEERSYHEEAGVLYELAGKKRQAMESFARRLLWQQAMAIAHELDLDKTEIAKIATELADELVGRTQFKDAAVLLLDHAQNPTSAIETLLAGSLWADATRLAHKYNLSGLVISTIHPAVHAGHVTLLSTVREMSKEYESRTDRLRRWRDEQARLLAMANDPNATTDPLLDTIDMFSDTTSMATTRMSASTGTSSFASTLASRTTVRTARTAKGKRKLERKRATGRDLAFEDEYLLTCIRKLVDRSNSMRPDVLALIRVLVVADAVDKAREVQFAFRDMLQLFKNGMRQVFITTPKPAMETAEQFRNRVMEGAPPPPPTIPEPAPIFSEAPYGLPIFE